MASSSSSRATSAPPSAFPNSQRLRPVSRRAASSFDVRPYDAATIQRHHRTASSSAMPFSRSCIISRPASPTIPASTSQGGDPRLSRIVSTVLGSPFHHEVHPPDNVLDGQAQGGRSSPTPTADFSIIDADIEDSDSNPFIPGGYPTRFRSTPRTFGRGRSNNYNAGNIAGNQDSSPQSPGFLKSILPRLWDVFTSPSRATNVNSTPTQSSSSRTISAPSQSNPSWYTTPSGRNSPVYWNAGKGKWKAGTRNDTAEVIDYSELPPLDGEEGELIDDEACFIDVQSTRGIDIISLLPTELALHVLSLLCLSNTSAKAPVSPGRSNLTVGDSDGSSHEALEALLSCRLVSRTWCRLASDNAVWRVLFLSRWDIDLRRAGDSTPQTRNVRATLGKTWDVDLVDIGSKAKRLLGLSFPVADAPVKVAPLRLDWRIQYRERLELDLRWANKARGDMFGDLNPSEDSTRRMGGIFSGMNIVPLGSTRNVEVINNRSTRSYEPTAMQIAGHTDSVYCLEFDSRRIITGSRDRSIKVWSLRTGKLLGSFVGAHRGSVLCLKFETDWDRPEWKDNDTASEEEESFDDAYGSYDGIGSSTTGLVDQPRKQMDMDDTTSQKSKDISSRVGFMVSGSSDCSVCVWNLTLGAVISDEDSASVEDNNSVRYADENSDREVTGEVRAILKGHSGGVLDLRIDKQWIVSCSKDAVIRVWNRKSLKLHRALRGHEGPVNAVGLQSGKVVSASGDGKMILWDIDSGERLRTFEGHDRGLACIEFKDDLIVSGSNDCKIKVWRASTGDCLRTLMGHDALVRALSFDPRSGRLVSASYDKSVKVWDLSTGKLVREFQKIHASHIFDVKFDIGRIVSTSHDQKIVVLDFSTDLNVSLFV
ncbi:hypothetical protein D9613_011179 [Agrocybe pediades]|uniref:F-box domain-containing protein n=1 Tax=Agrocybe pediades TaxID=84607 RepID=A0A8H4VM65_9AGAR|nr:hypothetical protein D9613_011179 [Agrocybe pediades]